MPIRVVMRRSLAIAVSSIAVLVVFGAVAAIILLTVPVGRYTAIPAQPVQFAGSPPTSVYAVAVAGPETSWGIFLAGRLGFGEGDTSSEHATDGPARRSREEAWAAAKTILGTPPMLWSATGAGDSGEQLLEDIQCNDGEKTCAGLLVAGSLEGVRYEEPVKVTFPYPESGTFVPVLDVPVTSLPVSLSLSGWSGGSASLAYTLAYLEYLTGQLITPAGLKVAATGGVVVSPVADPLVTEVEAVDEKVLSAEQSGVDVLFIPQGTMPPLDGDGLTVVEVETVNDAVRWLCERGAMNSLCFLDSW